MIGKRAVGLCPDCGKQRYLTRSIAKRAARRNHPNEHMSPYMCGEYWHYGKMPSVISRGRGDRQNMREYPPSMTTRKRMTK